MYTFLVKFKLVAKIVNDRDIKNFHYLMLSLILFYPLCQQILVLKIVAVTILVPTTSSVVPMGVVAPVCPE